MYSRNCILFVVVNAHVMLTTGITTTMRMLPVLSDAPIAHCNITAKLPCLP